MTHHVNFANDVPPPIAMIGAPKDRWHWVGTIGAKGYSQSALHSIVNFETAK